jgi:hypothetical protein
MLMGVALFECQKIAGQILPQRSVIPIKQRLCQPVEVGFFLIAVIQLLHAVMRMLYVRGDSHGLFLAMEAGDCGQCLPL